jgi:hypothetical protein
LASVSDLRWDAEDGSDSGSVDGLTGTSFSYTIPGLQSGMRYLYSIDATRDGVPFDTDSVAGTFVTWFVDECGDGICSAGEDYLSCPDDCDPPCEPSWTVSDWSECRDGIEIRTVTDLNDCGINPPPTQRCCAEGCTLACGQCQRLDVASQSCVAIWPCCGDRVCEDSETANTCAIDCSIPPTYETSLADCVDGYDNVADTFVDYPSDPGCDRPSDDSEYNIAEIIAEIREVLDRPEVQRINQITAIALIASVVANTFTLFSFFNFFSYLQYLFTQPLAALYRRRRRKWGVVYNSLTKQPIDLAIVRLYLQSNGRLVQSRVTDRQGRYVFIVDEGRYYLTVTKPEHDFPTTFVKNKVEDASFIDLYFGGTFDVTKKQASVTFNIPIDPQERVQPAAKIMASYYLRRVQYAVAFAAIPVSAIAAVISPKPWAFFMLGVHCLLYVLFRRLGYQKMPKSWGVVYDQHTHKPLGRAIARIYDKHYNKLLETRVTDASGRYAFLVNSNIFYVTTERLGYETKKVEDINLTDTQKEAAITLDIGMRQGVSADIPQAPQTRASNNVIVQAPVEQVPGHTDSPNSSVGREQLERILQQKNNNLVDHQPVNPLNQNVPSVPAPEKIEPVATPTPIQPAPQVQPLPSISPNPEVPATPGTGTLSTLPEPPRKENIFG